MEIEINMELKWMPKSVENPETLKTNTYQKIL